MRLHESADAQLSPLNKVHSVPESCLGLLLSESQRATSQQEVPMRKFDSKDRRGLGGIALKQGQGAEATAGCWCILCMFTAAMQVPELQHVVCSTCPYTKALGVGLANSRPPISPQTTKWKEQNADTCSHCNVKGS